MSAQFIWSPQDLNTRLCAAQNCPDESSIGHALCTRHERARQAGRSVPLHELPAQQEPKLRCSACFAWLPDASFPPHNGKVGGPVRDRRGRHWRCHDCTQTASIHLATQEQLREWDNARQRARRAANKRTK